MSFQHTVLSEEVLPTAKIEEGKSYRTRGDSSIVKGPMVPRKMPPLPQPGEDFNPSAMIDHNLRWTDGVNTWTDSGHFMRNGTDKHPLDLVFPAATK